MEAVVAVYSDWGIGAQGTQPLVVPADRVRFRELTTGHAVIVGRKTLEDFPGGKPLPNRMNVVLSTGDPDTPGIVVCHKVEEVLMLASVADKPMVIGGGTVYRLFLPYCDRVYVTKVHTCPKSDTYFPNLDEDPNWTKTQVLQSGEENGIAYEMCLYERV
jgi:dihydrofolate reductase